MNKEIEEMIKEGCGYQIYSNGNTAMCECSGLPCDYECDEIDFAEQLYDVGYRKIVWHKVADGDLPKVINDLVIAVKCNDGAIRTVAGNYRLERFNVSDLGEIDRGNVIAWTELPKYEGEE